MKAGWQKDYVRGMTLGGVRAKEHQTKLKLKDFGEGLICHFSEQGHEPQRS